MSDPPEVGPRQREQAGGIKVWLIFSVSDSIVKRRRIDSAARTTVEGRYSQQQSLC